MQLTLNQPTDLFGALSDRQRLRLACCLLTVRDGLCVCELVDALEESQPNVSRGLKLMKAADLVEERREGRWVYYRLKNAEHPLFDQIRSCLETVCSCSDIREDMRRLRARLRLRQGGKCVIGFQKTRPAPASRRRAGKGGL
jgi:ArsR family transcriptional regulator